MTKMQARTAQFGIVTREAHDAFHHSALAASWSHSYEQLLPGPYHSSMTDAWLGPIEVGLEQIDQPFSYRGHAWHGARVFFSYLAGSRGVYYDGRAVSPDVLVSHRWDDVDAVLSSTTTRLAFIVVDEKTLEQHSIKMLGSFPLERKHGSATAEADPHVVRRFQHCVSSVLAELKSNPSVFANEHSRREMQNHVLNTLVASLPAPSRVVRLPHPTTRAYIVKEAIRYMAARLAEPLGTVDISEAVGVCSRTLEYSFANVMGISPKQYLLVARLNRARRELIMSQGCVPIQNVAARWGFSHMGRFSSYYRRTFGEAPSETRASGSKRRAA